MLNLRSNSSATFFFLRTSRDRCVTVRSRFESPRDLYPYAILSIRSSFVFFLKRYFRIYGPLLLISLVQKISQLSLTTPRFCILLCFSFFGINFQIWVSNSHLGFGLVEQSIVDSLFFPIFLLSSFSFFSITIFRDFPFLGTIVLVEIIHPRKKKV